MQLNIKYQTSRESNLLESLNAGYSPVLACPNSFSKPVLRLSSESYLSQLSLATAEHS